ncbi:trypsin-like serine protease [Belnapia moabensis]|uniref:trypsin-like serine protease n=1 Tax=Belnapia moabensis TaxID=365533 RepID=UPI0038CD8671
MDAAPLLASSDSRPQVTGGRIASRDDWPSTLAFRTASGVCTATAIGPRVVLTAAHCVDDGATGIVRLNPSDEVGVRCDHHPRYRGGEQGGDISADYALCLTAGPMPVPTRGSTVVGFEVLETSAERPGDGAEVVLLGFGCSERSQYGLLNEGDANVTVRPPRSQYGRNYIETGLASGAGQAAVCPGDSGGGAFTSSLSGRRVFGVNSRVRDGVSWISATSTDDFRAWANGWVEDPRRRVAICGLVGPQDSCRR